MQFLKTIKLAVATVLALSTSAVAENAAMAEFRELVRNGKIKEVEQLLTTLDQEIIAGGYVENNRLRQLFGQFSTTHPDYVDFASKWAKEYPDSIYQKVARGWQFSHLGWATRGTALARETHVDAFRQMYNYLDLSSELAWDVFKQRNDFVPASDLVAIHYLHGNSEWHLDDFTRVAMAANRSYALLQKILYANSPKWGGSFEKIKELCEEYAVDILAPDIYNADICRAKFVYGSVAIYTDNKPKILSWAQNILDHSDTSILDYSRFRDYLYLRTDHPNAKDFLIKHFNPAAADALEKAETIEFRYDAVGFAKQQYPAIKAAIKFRKERDPLNPEYLMESAMDLTYTGEWYGLKWLEDPVLHEKHEQLLRDQLVYGQYLPNVWRRLGNADKRTVSDHALSDQAIQYYQRSVVLSNYSPMYLHIFFDRLSDAHTNFSVKARNNVVEYLGQSIDPKAEVKRLSCPLIQAARLLQAICGDDGKRTRACRYRNLSSPKEWLIDAKKRKICIANINIPLEELLIDLPPNL